MPAIVRMRGYDAVEVANATGLDAENAHAVTSLTYQDAALAGIRTIQFLDPYNGYLRLAPTYAPQPLTAGQVNPLRGPIKGTTGYAFTVQNE